MALPSRPFDCFTPCQYFCFWQSLSIPLFVAVTDSSFVCGSLWQYLAVPVNTSVCGSHWQFFCLWLSLAVLFSVTLLLRLQRGFVWFTLPRPPPLRLKIIFIKMSVYIKINYPSEPSSIKFEPLFKNSPVAPLIVTLPGCTFGCDTLIM